MRYHERIISIIPDLCYKSVTRPHFQVGQTESKGNQYSSLATGMGNTAPAVIEKV